MVTGLEHTTEAIAWAFNTCLSETKKNWYDYTTPYINKLLVDRLYRLLDLYELLAPSEDGSVAPFVKGNRIGVDKLAEKLAEKIK